MTEVARRRLRAQGVAGRGFSSVPEAASGLLALQAQDLHAVKWALALRSTGSLADVDAALDSGAIVRSWPMRGTLMFAARDDLRWLTELLGRPRSAAWPSTAATSSPRVARRRRFVAATCGCSGRSTSSCSGTPIARPR
ncbi:DNA glycosylase AlkZ-like family protein [Frondihabitans sp. PhB188]|uniref:DNA glycosylase AlkZ-like family protein n=1 Tax=Frondihabitans sp. PhB188 TaxID=2485200 RepID=UPI000F4A04EC|nr:crosslink repair DNA glycosylase YcaQ family protein [Frondihabitans sp. PhB188]